MYIIVQIVNDLHSSRRATLFIVTQTLKKNIIVKLYVTLEISKELLSVKPRYIGNR